MLSLRCRLSQSNSGKFTTGVVYPGGKLPPGGKFFRSRHKNDQCKSEERWDQPPVSSTPMVTSLPVSTSPVVNLPPVSLTLVVRFEYRSQYLQEYLKKLEISLGRHGGKSYRYLSIFVKMEKKHFASTLDSPMSL
jgi:hypothetical protein